MLIFPLLWFEVIDKKWIIVEKFWEETDFIDLVRCAGRSMA